MMSFTARLPVRRVCLRLAAVTAALLAGLPAVALISAGTAQAQSFQPIATGDLIASLGNGQVNEYTPSGGLVQTLVAAASTPTGTAFDPSGNLYVTEFGANDIL